LADSFTHQLAARAETGLRAGGHEVTTLDLYDLGFLAAMTGEERSSYHSEEPICDPMVAEHVDIIRHVDALIFVYPTWSSGLPAILKAWFERVMVPGVAFRFHERTGKVRPALGNVRRDLNLRPIEKACQVRERQRPQDDYSSVSGQYRIWYTNQVARVLRRRYRD